ncbi:MAG TPA: FUSC family protein [Bacteroidetes bacterium]|nr:FUSC family protein [Bacteroidota bacterium]
MLWEHVFFCPFHTFKSILLKMYCKKQLMPKSLEQSSKQLKQFLYSQYFSDGFRITLGILLPSIICYHFNYIEVGITLSLGALGTSIPDNPGPPEHRRNAMLITIGLSFLMAISTGLLTYYPWVLALFIGVSCFLLSMLNIFGARAAAVGVSVLVVMVLGIDTQLTWQQTFLYATFLLGGGIWYFLLSIISQGLLPYRAAEQTLGECILEVAAFMRIKAEFYNEDSVIDENYKKTLNQQVIINQQQQNVRDILFRTRKLLNDTSLNGRKLVLTFVDLVDLYEQINATHYKYESIRLTFADKGILELFHKVIIKLAEELEHIGEGIHNHQKIRVKHDFLLDLTLIKSKIDTTEREGVNVLVLKRILINLRNIAYRVNRMHDYQHKANELSILRSKDLTRFVDRQLIDWNLFRANLSLTSNHCRHAARVAIVCLLAYVFTLTVSEGPHSYWILLTIIVILKPGYSLTKQRNIERIIGTVIGGIIGLGVLTFFPTDAARFGFLVLFMLLTFSFIRIKYVVSVLFMTPYILIVFSFTTSYNDSTVAWERIIDTFIGAGAAILGSYFVFPSWESYQLKTAVVDTLKSNVNYLKKMVERSSQNQESQSAYRLSRKASYVSSANLTTAFQRMLSEPKSKQTQADLLYRLVVLNNQLNSYLATLSYQLEANENLSDDQLKQLRSIWFVLKETYEKITCKELLFKLSRNTSLTENDLVQNDFLREIHQTSVNIRKTALELIQLNTHSLKIHTNT